MASKLERKVLTVTELTGRIKGLLETEFGSVWVEGEISNFTRATSGHLYFTLKDETAQLRCVCFRSNARSIRFNLEDGLKVIVRGSVSVYERRGEYQLYAEVMEPVGIGALQLAFEQLKAKLQAEGLFDAARKKPLPLYPRKIGVVTSPTGAAIRDILRVLKRRNKSIDVLIYPAKVQGGGAAEEIAAGIGALNERDDIDVILVGRGGGSIEDLWAFNEEIVARAIAASRIPIISGVGHEIDFTISDFVADLRAPTPSAAAEIVSAAQTEIQRHVSVLVDQLKNALSDWVQRLRLRLLELTGSCGFSIARSKLQEFRQVFDELAYKMLGGERSLMRERRNRFLLMQNRLLFFDWKKLARLGRLRLNQSEGRLRAGEQRQLSGARNRWLIGSGKLETLSPLKVLERGYAIVKTAQGAILKDPQQTALGELLSIRLSQGDLKARVTESSSLPRLKFGDKQTALNFED